MLVYDPEKEYDLADLMKRAGEGDLDAKGDLVMFLTANVDEEDEEMNEIIVGLLEDLAVSDPVGMAMLGGYYARGKGVHRDGEKAKSLFLAAGAAGIKAGYEFLGQMYYEGRGIKRNYRLALRYMTKSKQKDVMQTTYYLADMYWQGHHVRKNLVKAKRLLEEIVYTRVDCPESDAYYCCAQFRLAQLLRELSGGYKKNYLQTALKLAKEALAAGEEGEYVDASIRLRTVEREIAALERMLAL